MAKLKITSVLCAALDILQMAFAVLVVVLTMWKLLNIDLDGAGLSSSCLLDVSEDSGFLSGSQFCIYVIVVGVASFIVNALFGCVRRLCKCVTLDACAASKVLGIVGDAALGIWWAVAFALLVRKGTAANKSDWPEKGARDWVIAASFGAMASFFLDIVVTVCGLVMS